MRSLPVLVCLAALMAPALVSAQTAPAPTVATVAQPLTVERIFGKDAIRGDYAGASRWTRDGNGYSAVEKSKDVKDGYDLVRYDVATGARTMLVSARDLTPKGADKPISIQNYAWSPDERRLLVMTNGQSFRRTNALADYWVLDLDTKALRKVGGAEVAPSTTMYAEFSPDGTRIAYVRANDLYVEPATGGAAERLTRDGSDLIVNGLGDWVYEEEFGLRKAFAWSPDSRKIAYWRFDTSGVGTFDMVSNLNGQYSKIVPLQYPKAGTTNSAVKVGAVDVASGATTWFALEGDPRQTYVPRMSWAGASDAVIIQQSNRLQNTYKVMLGNPADGSIKPLFVEKDAAWVEANDPPEWLRGGKAFTWTSERDGWRHLYVVPRAGGKPELRTPGNFDVIDVLTVDEKAGYAWFVASPDKPTQRYLYRATLTGKPRVERVTPASVAGTHGYDIAPGERWAKHSFSAFDVPPTTDMIDLASGRVVRPIVRNEGMKAAVAGLPRGEFTRVDVGGGTVLDAWIIKPANFDPAKKYPMLVHVYGEPAGQTVSDSWGGANALWHKMLAQRGYVVASIDPRGVASPRGRAWRKSIYGQVGVLAIEDIANGTKRLIAANAYIDPTRVGIWGWSGGGSSTQHEMFKHPEIFSTGIAVAGVTDQKLYDSIYQERYMGLPEGNPKGYHDGSPINYAEGLRGNLLLVHGTGDDNVHYQNMDQLTNRLIGLNKPFTMMAYPDRMHGISEGGPNTRVHLYTLMTKYLADNLPAGGR